MPAFPSNKLINDTLGLITSSTPYLALYTSNPGANDTGTEVSGGSYARKAITFGSVTAGAISNTAAINFSSVPTANITHYGIKTAASGGDLLVYGALSSTAAVVSGDEVTFPIGEVSVSLSGS